MYFFVKSNEVRHKKTNFAKIACLKWIKKIKILIFKAGY